METLEIQSENDIVLARQRVRTQADMLDYSLVDKTRIATAVSELARNVLVHGNGGHMQYETLTGNGKTGICCVFSDTGPGITDIEQAMVPGFSTGKGLGQGLSGSQRLMDEFTITSESGKGTRVEIIKWK